MALGLIRRFFCCVVQKLGGGKCDNDNPPMTVRTTRPERPMVQISLRDLPGIDFETATDEEVLRALRTYDESWQQLERQFGPLTIQRAITTDAAALRRMVARAQENAKKYGVNYVDPQFKRWFYVPLPRTTANPTDLYCSLKGTPRFSYVHLSAPSRPATSGNYRLAANQRGVGAVPVRSSVPPPNLTGIAVVDIEKAWLPSTPGTVIIAAPPRAESNHPNDIAHGVATMGVLVADGTPIDGVAIEGVVPGAEAYRCPFLLQTNPAADPFPLIESAITETVKFLAEKYPGPAAGWPTPGHVILLEQETEAGTPLESKGFLWSTIQTAVLNDLIVVQPAGNGWGDLKDVVGEMKVPPDSYVPRPLTDDVASRTGAIIVAAGNSREDLVTPLGQRIDSSNVGELVDCWAWGDGILTVDTDRNPVNPVPRPHTSGYGETSGAAAIVAGAIVLMQGVRKANGLPLLNAGQVRTLLRNHGAHIGSNGLEGKRMPDLEAMMSTLTSPAPIPMS